MVTYSVGVVLLLWFLLVIIDHTEWTQRSRSCSHCSGDCHIWLFVQLSKYGSDWLLQCRLLSQMSWIFTVYNLQCF